MKDIRTLPEGTLLVTLDVNNLYTSIQHVKGIRVTERILRDSQKDPNVVSFLLNLLELVLTENFFLFEDTFYVQVQGSAMGSNVAPPYANCFMSIFKSDYIYNNELFQSHCLLWHCYIDDVFCLWRGSQDTLFGFLEHINSVWPELLITVDLYVKETDRNNLLLYQSCHPTAVKKSIPCSQFERVRRIVSDPIVRSQRLNEMEEKFSLKGYPPRMLNQCRNTTSSNRDSGSPPRIPLVHTFHPFMYRFHNKIRKHWHILRDSFPEIPEFQVPFMPCFRRPNNLRNKVVRADIGSRLIMPKQTFLQTQKKGTFPCLQCAQCANVLKGPKISHQQTGADIPIRGFFTCNSKQVIYAIKCPCGKIYVGETMQTIKDRISHHKSDIRCGKNYLPIPYHFQEAGHSVTQLRFLVLEQVNLSRRGGDINKQLLRREAYWIHFLQSLEPKGLNRDYNLTGSQLIASSFVLVYHTSPDPHAPALNNPRCIDSDGHCTSAFHHCVPLSRFDFKLQFRPGSKNTKADAFSRSLQPKEVDEAPSHIIDPAKFLTVAPMRVLPAPPGKNFVPQDKRLEVLLWGHSSKISGHVGIKKTLNLLSRYYWWSTLRQDVHDFVATCATCARNKVPRKLSFGLLHPLPVPEGPWQQIAMDFITDLPCSSGCATILVVVDRFSKMAHFVPLPGLPSAPKLAKIFILQIFRLHGLPQRIVSDRGVQFRSRFWRALCKLLGISLDFSSSNHPQTNGQVERINQVLSSYLRHFTNAHQDDWVELLPWAEFAHNNHPNESSTKSPFLVVYGRNPGVPLPVPPSSGVPAADVLSHDFSQVRRETKDALVLVATRMKRHADKRRRDLPPFHPGDRVWRSTRHIRLKIPSYKLGPHYIGPFEILKRINNVAYKLRLPASLWVPNAFHVSLLKPVILNRFSSPTVSPLPFGDDNTFEVRNILAMKKV
ncbi:unnamed protein product [Ranitomeya imitator]|uniref:Gypsy retrotransposon integrase-like protein 1 n=1 Tax=Ranitomeya imitator TaxID=111125 RepID=A0ABN9MP24_9NEOB|nr:unnamed protein product [Ranitomeya imitator]